MRRFARCLSERCCWSAPAALHASRTPLPHPSARRQARADRRRRAVPDARRADQQQQQLPGDAAQGLAGHSTSSTRTRSRSRRLGADRAGRRPVRFLLGRHPAARRRGRTTCGWSCSGSGRGRTPARSYTPEWVKSDTRRFPRMMTQDGRTHYVAVAARPHRRSRPTSSAFAALMRHLRDADPQHTVIMVQVENETGSYGIARDFSPDGHSACSPQPIPAELARTRRQERHLVAGIRQDCRPGVQRLVRRALRR